MSATATATKQASPAATANKAASTPLPPSRINAPPGAIQAPSAMKVSSPHDPAEKEAEDTAKRVMQAPPSAATAEAPGAAAEPVVMRSPYVARMMNAIVQRESAIARMIRTATPASMVSNPIVQREAHIASIQPGQPNVSANLAAEIRGSKATGAPLPPSVRRFMEPRLGADLGDVRVHTDAKAAKRNEKLNAKAFTVGNDIHFGAGQFQPEMPHGKELIAHELTHTLQQRAAPATQAVHRDLSDYMPSLPDPREYIAGKANAIPGFTLFTVIIGFNPITKASVDRSAGNILRGAIEIIPGGSYITDALANHGIFDKVSTWVQTQFDAIKDIGSGIWDSITSFIKGIKLTDLGDIGELWERGKSIVTGPVDQAIAFAKNLKDGIVQLIKDAILKPIGAFARTTSGYPLLCSIMGHDPITGEAAPQDADALLGGFLTFIGEGELWAKMQNAKAVPRAFAWFNGAVSALKGFVSEIPGLFVAAFKSLEIMDIILIPRAFAKLANIFGGFAGRFISWGAKAAWDLLELIFDVVKPGAMGYVKRTGAALKSILKNPMPFVGNLVAAGKLGFTQFGSNFLKHLKAGLLEWLKGALPGVYIPTAFELKEILKFVLSVLGLTWANMRAKLVKVIGETPVKLMEEGFSIVVTLVKEGPAAAWEQLKASLGNLRDMAIGAITDFVVDTVVSKAVPKIMSMFIPGAGFIGAIVSIYDTVMVFVQKMTKIAQVIGAFIDSIVQIAAGNIGGAAKRVESVLAGMLSLAISFLAGFAGLNKIGDKIMGVIQKIRAPIDKAIDGAITWVVAMAKKLFAKAFNKAKSAVKSLFSWAKAKKTFRSKDGHSHSVLVQEGDDAQLMIASSPTKAGAFLDAYLAGKGADFAKENEAKISAARAAIGPAETAVKAANTAQKAAKKAGKEDDPALQPLLDVAANANAALAAAMGALLDVEGIVGPLGIQRKQLSWQPATKKYFDDQMRAKLGAAVQENKDGSVSYLAAEIDIRHKVSAKDMIENTNNTLQPQKLPAAVTTLKGFQGGPYYSANTPERPGIIKGAFAFLMNMYNDTKNLFLGGMKINRRLGRRFDAGDTESAKDQKHVQYRADFATSWGFKDDFTVTLEMKDKNTPVKENKADRDKALGK